MQQSFFRLRKILISLLDALVVLGSVIAAFRFQQSGWCKECMPIDDPIHYLWLPILAIMIFPYCFKITNLYNMTKSLISIMVRIMVSAFLGIVGLVNILYFMDETAISRITIIVFAAILVVTMFIQRAILKDYYRGHAKKKTFVKRTLVVGTAEMYGQFYDHLKVNDDLPVQNIGYVSIRPERQEAVRFRDCVGDIHQLDELIKQYHIDEVVFAVDQKNLVRAFKYCYKVQEMGVSVSILSDQFHTDDMYISTGKIGGFNVITAHSVALNNMEVVLKRVLDIAGGLVGCLITGFLIAILGPLIYMEDKGPIFFSQDRVGKNGRVFKIHKFRSMYTDAEARKAELMQYNEMKGHMFKMKNDPRITRIGRFIRKTSLDEFPQFWNVLKGDMSLVGTRPPTVNEVQQYDNSHRKRISIKPGITGNWQISGRSETIDFEEVVRLDTEYINRWNLWKDLKILYKTFYVVIFSRGAA